tara:strand:+ start:305 stop:541 length:237 start_codon:yes stop_codon:yes gene_type:complete
MNAFEEMCGAEPSAKAIATSKAAHDVVYGKAGLVRACAHFHVREQAVIQYIIDKTEYETKIDIERAMSAVDPDNYGNK